MNNIYLGTVCMEKNRWEPGRIPTFNVSEYLERAVKDGFYGIELWQYHYLSASEEEQAKLASANIPCVFNSYLDFEEYDEKNFKLVAEAIKAVKATKVKFNLGSSCNCIPDIRCQIHNLKRFAELLPEDVVLLSECHGNTVMEYPKYAREIFNCLDEKRFGAILHMAYSNTLIDQCFDAYGERISHIHCAYHGADGKAANFAPFNDGTDTVKDKIAYIKSKGFDGTYTIEFVKFEDTVEAHYKNAVDNMKFLKTLV